LQHALFRELGRARASDLGAASRRHARSWDLDVRGLQRDVRFAVVGEDDPRGRSEAAARLGGSLREERGVALRPATPVVVTAAASAAAVAVCAARGETSAELAVRAARAVSVHDTRTVFVDVALVAGWARGGILAASKEERAAGEQTDEK